MGISRPRRAPLPSVVIRPSPTSRCAISTSTPGLDLDRLDRRRSFVNALDTFHHGVDQSQATITDPILIVRSD